MNKKLTKTQRAILTSVVRNDGNRLSAEDHAEVAGVTKRTAIKALEHLLITGLINLYETGDKVTYGPRERPIRSILGLDDSDCE